MTDEWKFHIEVPADATEAEIEAAEDKAVLDRAEKEIDEMLRKNGF